MITGFPLVLVVGDPAGEVGAIERGLEECDVEVRSATSIGEARDVLKRVPVAMLITECDLAGSTERLELLRWARAKFPEIKRVLISETVDRGLMTEAVNFAGINYFIPLPANLKDLREIVEQLLAS